MMTTGVEGTLPRTTPSIPGRHLSKKPAGTATPALPAGFCFSSAREMKRSAIAVRHRGTPYIPAFTTEPRLLAMIGTPDPNSVNVATMPFFVFSTVRRPPANSPLPRV